MRTPARQLDVAIVGSGPAGLAAALSLKEAGLQVAVISRDWPQGWSAADGYDLRVVALAPDAVALLRHLQVWESIAQARAQPVLGMRIDEAEQATQLKFEAAESGQPALAWIVELSLLADKLARAWSERGGVVHDGQVSELQTTADGAVLHLDGADRIRARLVVAADGAGSPLRLAAGIGVEQRDYDQRAIVAAVTTEHGHQQLARQRFLPGGPLAFLPLVDGRSSIVWSTASAHAEQLLGLDDAAFCRALGAVSGGMLGEILASSARAAFPLRMQLAKRYQAPRLLLLGDAAHQVHPLAGQGLNLGLRDVRRLTEVMSWAAQGDLDPGAPAVLRRYERPQRSENWLAAHAFDGLERWFAIADGPLAQIRRGGFDWIANSPLAKHWLLRRATG